MNLSSDIFRAFDGVVQVIQPQVTTEKCGYDLDMRNQDRLCLRRISNQNRLSPLRIQEESTMQKKFLIGYLIFIHLCLIFFLFRSIGYSDFGSKPEMTQFYKNMVRHHTRTEGNIPDGAVVFIGDSMTQGLNCTSICSYAVNFGIGGDTTVGVLKRIPKYKSLKRASACVLAIGVNDLLRRDNDEIRRNFDAILKAVPPHLPIVVSGVLPVDERVDNAWSGFNQRIRDLNGGIKSLCDAQASRCRFVDSGPRLVDTSGNLAEEYHEEDGVHLTANGYRIWIEDLTPVVFQAKLLDWRD